MRLFILTRCILILIKFLSFFLMFSLITFYPFDDTYLQFTGNAFFHNAFGKLGAFSADILFFIFGLIAYFFPCLAFYLSWIFFFDNACLNLLSLFCKIFGLIISLFSLCGLTEFFLEDFYYCFSGGVLGKLVRAKMLYIFNDTWMNFILLLFLILGAILLINSTFLCYKNFFLNAKNKLMNIKNKIKIWINSFVCWSDKYLKIKFFREKESKNINFLQRICCFIKYIHGAHIYRFLMSVIRKIFNDSKNYCITRLIHFNFGALLFRESQICNLNSDAVQLLLKDTQSCNQHSHLNHGEYLNHHITYYNPKKNIKQDQKYVSSSNCRIKRLVPQMNTVEFLRKGKTFKENSKLFPDINLLSSSPCISGCISSEFIKKQSELLESKLADYRVQARVVNVLQGPVVTRFELDLAPGLKSSRISNLSRDLARSLSISNLRIIEVIPGKPYVGLEIPNHKREIVYLRDILDTEKFRTSHGLVLCLGKDISGLPVLADLCDMPHLLIAGTTGSGKSVGVNSMIISILYKLTPEDVRFVMIDPKILELSVYNGIPHLITNVVTNMNEVIDILNWCIEEMEYRYKIMACYGARNLKSYNDHFRSCEVNQSSKSDSHFVKFNNDNFTNSSMLSFKRLPYVVIIIDEFADLVMVGGKEVELLIIRLSQKARACGMHLILATQRPSVNVITGLIKANIPSRIAFTVSSKVDSRTILDRSGAESLLGRGDMLYLGSCSSTPMRIHGAFVSDDEIFLIAKHWKSIF